MSDYAIERTAGGFDIRRHGTRIARATSSKADLVTDAEAQATADRIVLGLELLDGRRESVNVDLLLAAEELIAAWGFTTQGTQVPTVIAKLSRACEAARKASPTPLPQVECPF